MASQSPPPPSAEIKSEEQPAESKEPEVAEDAQADGNAETPAVEPESEAMSVPTAAPATSISKQVVDVIEGLIHRVVSYQSEE